MTSNSIEYIISITSRDRIGIVHEISSALAELAGNIADSRQSVMCGYYTMIMRASFPTAVTRQIIEAKLAEVDRKSPAPLNILVNSIDEPLPTMGNPENRYVLTASGADQIGFVARVAGFCVKHQINILDLSTTLSDGEFVMMLEVDLSRCGSISEVRNALAEFCKENTLRAVLQHYDIFKAVNEISLPIRPKREH
jgi:glycine cleavage system transcriptional repressor